MVKPSRGNSHLRSARTIQVNKIAKNIVFSYRAKFGHMPPISEKGWVVDLLREVFEQVGISGVDPADVLRRYVDKDPVGKLLPSASEVKKASKRPK